MSNVRAISQNLKDANDLKKEWGAEALAYERRPATDGKNSKGVEKYLRC